MQTVMTQAQEFLVLDHLRNVGSITGLEASALYKVRSLPRRILTLKQQGHCIHSSRYRDHTGQRYVRYLYQGLLDTYDNQPLTAAKVQARLFA